MNKVRINERAAGYMELRGAVKDGECSVVEVPDGISRDRGCCNNFWPPTAKKFTCGTCVYVEDEGEQYGEEDGKPRPIGKREAAKMSDEELLNSDRPVFGKVTEE